MHSHESVTAWLKDLKQGQSLAAEKLWSEYVERLVRLAHRKLGNAPRRVADEEDVVLSAFGHFLNGVKDNRFAKLDDRHDLWQVLVMLTERRAIGQRRHDQAQKRGGDQVRGESIFRDPDHSENAGLDGVAELREATPEFAAEFAEQMHARLEQLADDTLQRIALGKLEGRTNPELAAELDVSLSTIERKLSLIRDIWRGELDGS